MNLAHKYFLWKIKIYHRFNKYVGAFHAGAYVILCCCLLFKFICIQYFLFGKGFGKENRKEKKKRKENQAEPPSHHSAQPLSGLLTPPPWPINGGPVGQLTRAPSPSLTRGPHMSAAPPSTFRSRADNGLSIGGKPNPLTSRDFLPNMEIDPYIIPSIAPARVIHLRRAKYVP